MMHLGISRLQQPIGTSSTVEAKTVMFVAKANFHFEFGRSRVALSTKSVRDSSVMILFRSSPLLKIRAVLKTSEFS